MGHRTDSPRFPALEDCTLKVAIQADIAKARPTADGNPFEVTHAGRLLIVKIHFPNEIAALIGKQGRSDILAMQFGAA
ncbi:hypothetical protein D3C72_1809300 [compost metagenome]